MLNQITNSLNFQSEALRLRSERQRLLSSNIANADTPGYVARDFSFGEALKQATGQGSSASKGLVNPAGDPGTLRMPTLALAGTQGAHLAKNGNPPGSNANEEMTYSLQSMTNLDQNTVDMDRERANFTDNTVRYEATLRFLNGQIKTLNTAITGQ
jgi:flagellar basal-body rod protein FlgB